jgi:hypothetical protein
LEKEKQINQDLAVNIDTLSNKLLKAEREIYKKAEKINHLSMAIGENNAETSQ